MSMQRIIENDRGKAVCFDHEVHGRLIGTITGIRDTGADGTKPGRMLWQIDVPSVGLVETSATLFDWHGPIPANGRPEKKGKPT